ncbi:MAG: NAD(P)/FAD-dependent oxidoreductase [Alphaproteobacteria bacterium]|nr:NAD(P)/FAD-dependent oxidoreductase [Alphaproteobacteria bacterium]
MSQRFLSPAHGLGISAIDRSRRLNFRLDGIEIRAYAGDTVLSAALGAGIAGAGSHKGAMLHLRPGFAPHVRNASDVNSGGVPMALCPVREGIDLVSVGGGRRGVRRVVARMGSGHLQTLAVDFAAFPVADLADRATLRISAADVLVVGGGLAGMTAALAAAKRGERVILVEQRGRLGGDAPLFGTKEGEEPVLETVAALAREIAERQEIEVRLLTSAVDAGPEGVTTIAVDDQNRNLAPSVGRIVALHIVLATGCADRLPVYPGNRLPGVAGLAESFYLAGAYGVWPQAPTLFSGGTNVLYHLAMLAKESGAALVRLIDSRISPYSRFVDFAKASGVPQQFGTRIARVQRRGSGLAVETTLAVHERSQEGRAVFDAGSVVHSDGWRPRLTLWARFGGALDWDGFGARAIGDQAAAGIALAGSVTGLLTNDGCRRSGAQAIAHLFGDPADPIAENRLADYIESPDAEPLRPRPSAGEPAFFSSGHVMASMPGAPRAAGIAIPARDATGALDLEALVGLTHAGLVPAAHFAALASEKLVSPQTLAAAEPAQGGMAGGAGIPAYLAGRFAEPVVRVQLAAEDERRLTPGLLVFVESGRSRPEQAIGVVIAATEAGGTAVLGRRQAEGLVQVSVRDGARPIAARIIG